MGVVWQVFVVLADGVGDAASARVSFYLAEGMPIDARRLSNKVACMTFTMVLIVTSCFYMLGPRLVVLLTKDATLQNLLNNLVGMTGLSNISMTVAQMYWSLAGAQGYYEMASVTILFSRWLIILPFAAIVIFRLNYDPAAAAGVVAVGYSIAACYLSCNVVVSDWENLVGPWYGEEGNTNNIRLENDEVNGERINNQQDDNDENDSELSFSMQESSLVSHRVV